MVAVPNPPTIATGGAWTSAIWNANIRDSTNFLTGPPLCVTRATVLQTLPTGAWTSLLFDFNEKDSDGGHSVITNTNRYTSQTIGWYDVVATAAFVVNPTGSRGARLLKNGASVPGRGNLVPSINVDTLAVQVSGTVFLAVGDFLEAQAWQNSGGNLNTAVLSDLTSYWSLRWVAR